MTAKPRSIDPVRWRPPPVTPLPEPDVHAPLRVLPVPGHAPEDVVVDAGGALWTGVDDGRILRIEGDDVAVVAATGGRPLGLATTRDGRLLICDSHRGLLRLDPATGELETLVAQVAGRPLMFCSNVVEASDGTIYFTESTDRWRYEYYKGAALEGRANGHLFRLGTDGSVDELLHGLMFANGVTLTADESALVYAETLAARLSTYHLTGPDAGRVTPLAEHLPCLPDNISTAPDGGIWAAMVAARNPVSELLAPRPPILRKLLWLLPYDKLPKLAPTVWAVKFDPGTGEVLRQLHTEHPDFAAATGLVEHAGRLWLGCIGSAALTSVDLS
ncbi:SMP-30/gluconolactonase/LRE family protein [Mycobacterium sp. MYCO198283]|uniref:SMP-30/gluconolactonase/LRE family protein n=1 Tax=Mycobacterium sp. MYCO198283 TaxID=2883505 RepID=UPI001E4C3F12|nr:SMP-30/gluconolactonase/LRE family protein [Mycobacterium sp. MYCO198283]MCG5431719.1 SMP-30/gluconolactonase/LRE family protein [Mycobacterium sp. MYCO198283]